MGIVGLARSDQVGVLVSQGPKLGSKSARERPPLDNYGIELVLVSGGSTVIWVPS